MIQENIRRAVWAALALDGDEYLGKRDEVVHLGAQALDALSELSVAPSPGITLLARTWRGWIVHAEFYRAVVNGFGVEEQIAPIRRPPGPPVPDFVAREIVRQVGERAIPLLAEILWKTGIGWAPWRVEACLIALGLISRRLTAPVLRQLAQVLDDEFRRAAVLALLSKSVGGENVAPNGGA